MQGRIPLNNLNTFAVAAEHLSFQEAAKILYVTPSAVSHQIRNLEKILGYKLFDRTDKGVRLTGQGERFYVSISTPLKQIHQASRMALRGHGGNSLALSVAPVFATSWLLPRLKDFYALHPDISLTVVASIDLTDFSTDPFDASIRLGAGLWENTISDRLFNVTLVAVCHPALLDGNKGLLTPAEVAQYPLIQNTYMPDSWEEWFHSSGVAMPLKELSRIQVQGSAQVIESLQSGDAIGVVDRNLIKVNIEAGRLSIASEHTLESGDGYFLTYPESQQKLQSLLHFREWLLGQLAIDGSR